jgi:hypothetical protein
VDNAPSCADNRSRADGHEGKGESNDQDEPLHPCTHWLMHAAPSVHCSPAGTRTCSKQPASQVTTGCMARVIRREHPLSQWTLPAWPVPANPSVTFEPAVHTFEHPWPWPVQPHSRAIQSQLGLTVLCRLDAAVGCIASASHSRATQPQSWPQS